MRQPISSPISIPNIERLTPSVLMSLSPFVAASRRNHVLLSRMCSSKQSQIDADYSTAEVRTAGQRRERARASKQCDLSLACNNAATRNRQRQTPTLSASASTSTSASASNQILTRHENFTFTHATTHAPSLSLSLCRSLALFCHCRKHVRLWFDVRTESRVATACSGNVTVLRLDCGCRVKCFYKFNCDSAFVRSGCECARDTRQFKETFVHSFSECKNQETRRKNNKQ